jgi:hypothetical protein
MRDTHLRIKVAMQSPSEVSQPNSAIPRRNLFGQTLFTLIFLAATYLMVHEWSIGQELERYGHTTQAEVVDCHVNVNRGSKSATVTLRFMVSEIGRPIEITQYQLTDLVCLDADGIVEITYSTRNPLIARTDFHMRWIISTLLAGAPLWFGLLMGMGFIGYQVLQKSGYVEAPSTSQMVVSLGTTGMLIEAMLMFLAPAFGAMTMYLWRLGVGTLTAIFGMLTLVCILGAALPVLKLRNPLIVISAIMVNALFTTLLTVYAFFL